MQKQCNDMKYSVFICVCKYDDTEDFLRAYKSIVNQTVPPSEIIVCADRPRGRLLECVRALEETCHVIYTDSHDDHALSRQTALEACKNELVAVMDADDVAFPDRFEKTLKYFEDDSVDVVGGSIREFSKETTELLGLRKVPHTDEEIKKYMIKRCPFNHMTVMYRKSAVQESGGYLPMYFNEDYYLWIRMAQNGARFANMDDVLCYVGVSDKSYDRRGGRKYFESEKSLQRYMCSHGIISKHRYRVNVFIRYVVQILMPAAIRKRFYNIFLRAKR